MEVSGQLHGLAALLLGRNPPPRYPLNRKLGGPHSQLNVAAKRKFPCSCQESYPGYPVRSLVTVQTYPDSSYFKETFQ
jgi:hypothetical protein